MVTTLWTNQRFMCLFTGAKHKKLVEQRKRKLGEQTEAEPAEKKASPDPKDSIPAVDSSAIVPFDQVGDATLGSHWAAGIGLSDLCVICLNCCMPYSMLSGGACVSQLGLNSNFDCCCCYCISLHIFFAAVAVFELKM